MPQIRGGIHSFPGLPHRQELVARINGVAFINDSKATNAAATARALATSTVEQSSSTAPGVMAGITSAATRRRMAPSGSMVSTTSAPVAAAAACRARP